jgi:uncharacterized membrane protein YfcA
VDYVIVCISALVASGLTLFSGFGLGTLLLPTFALFFPVTAAIAMTAIVHLLNNVFKLVLVGRQADRDVALRFGLPAIAASFVGAIVLVRLSGMEPVASYRLGGAQHDVTPVGVVIAAMMIVFAFVDVSPRFARVRLDVRHLPLGGALSGFFGGLSGHQGALRSAFLLKCGLDKAAFIGTGVAISCAVDLVRIGVYTTRYRFDAAGDGMGLLVAAIVAAFAGAFIGSRLIQKVSMRFIQRLVAAMLITIALGLGSGLL